MSEEDDLKTVPRRFHLPLTLIRKRRFLQRRLIINLFKYVRRHLLVTNLLPTGARKLFPCWDEHLKARFGISVKTPNLIVHSHMQHGNKPPTRLSRQISMRTGNLFGISTYSTGMVIAPKKAFTCIIDKSTPVNVWCRRSILQIGAAFTVTGDITRSLAWYTNSSLPLDKMYHVIIPGIQDDSITNWGFAVYE